MHNLNLDFNNIASVLCLNGCIPSAKFFAKYQHLPLIAADGASNRLSDQNIIPQVIIGDFDSINININNIKKNNIEFIQLKEQNSTDYEKCLQVISERNLFPTLVTGATGLEIDHTLYNLYITKQYTVNYNKKIFVHSFCLQDLDQYSVFVNSNTTVNLPINSKVSLLPFPYARVTTDGLKWELQKAETSIRNLTVKPAVNIEVESGCILLVCKNLFYSKEII